LEHNAASSAKRVLPAPFAKIGIIFEITKKKASFLDSVGTQRVHYTIYGAGSVGLPKFFCTFSSEKHYNIGNFS
jgi:hypothetical protein